MDVTKCVGKDCPLKDKCYRHIAPENCYQYYFTGIPGEMVDGEFKCEHYWETKEEEQ